MSNYLAIATVTAALKLSLKAAAETALGVEVKVDTLRPEAPASNGAGPLVNLYLYQVTPNAAWRNSDLPTRNAAGNVVDRPQVALDLNYLLSFYGDEDKLLPQRLLGCVARTLHARPVLTRKMIRDTIANPTFDYLAQSDLAEEAELVRFSPLAMSLEELSKLWSVFFQTPHALSVAYQGSVVLIESAESTQRPLPVRAPQLYVAPFCQPVIDEVRSQAGLNQPIVVGSTLILRGQRLSDPTTQVRVDGSPPVTPLSVSDDELKLPLTEPPTPDPWFPTGTLRAGVRSVQVVQPMLMGSPPEPHRGVESNVAAFVLQPTIVPPVTTSTLNSQRSVSVKLKPAVSRDQKVVLLLNELESEAPLAYSFALASRDTDGDELEIPVEGVKPADYLVRVRIDGAESPLTVDTQGRYVAPEVTIS